MCPTPPLPGLAAIDQKQAKSFIRTDCSSACLDPLSQSIYQGFESGDKLQLSYISRLVHASHLLELAILNRWANLHKMPSHYHCEDLDRKLTAFSSTVLRDGETGHGKNCSSLAICVK